MPPANLHELFQRAPERDDLVVTADRRWPTLEIAAAAGQLAAGLAERGVGPGDRVAFQLPVGAEAVIVYRACWWLGAVAVALHHLADGDRLWGALAQVDPAVTIAGPKVRLVSEPDVVVCGGAPWRDLLEAEPVAATAGRRGGPSVVLFTSGSSGPPKGVIHTHASLIAKTADSIDVHGLRGDDVTLMPAPLAHVSGLLHAVLVPGALGTKVVLMKRWDPGQALELIEAERVTMMVGPPTFFIGLMDHPAFAPERVASLRRLSCGGTGVTPSFVRRARQVLGCVVKRAYGSTEAPTVTTCRDDDDQERMATTDGRAHGATELAIRDDHGRPVVDGTEGELWIRGPELASGYLDTGQTAAAFVDGWYRSGDRARLDEGWLTVVGRMGDVIIRGGENIATAEVEHILEAHPAVRAAVVVGVPDERMGERVAAFVTTTGAFDLEESRYWFAESGAARFLAPEYLAVVDELPLLPSGKPDRAALARRAADVTDR